ncbi:hypothetical protein [Microbacterium foliorum]|uniref:Uncharacterized protein n=1 Tax=Microbacterium foliorum TaxID=104336 RepID=A0A0F0KV71_9MICO|nr:hypothetical protein [Microbacterium foliorum]KJL23151.1 hypothetical protein RN50_01089 [Microbacterium foliorum]
MPSSTPDLSRFANLLEEAESAFLTDTSYGVAVAEAASAMQIAKEHREDPEELRATVLRLHAQGAGVSEIKKVAHTTQEKIAAILQDAPERPQEARSATYEGEVEPLPAPRPVIPSKRLQKWVPQPLADNDERHGTTNGYRNYSCRCLRCSLAQKEAKRLERLEGPKGTRRAKAVHGTTSKYSAGCRCQDCKDAAATYAREKRASSGGGTATSKG